MRFLSCCCQNKGQRDIILLLVGLDNAGKTTAAKGLSKQDVSNVLPTAGFSTIKLRHRGYNILIYDLGGGPHIREIWPRYFSEIHGVMFVIDASDMDRIGESKRELKRLVLNDKISKKPILVLANKQDVPGALDEIDIIEKLSLEPLINAQRCPTRVEMCSFHCLPGGKMDPGLLNGYRWLLGVIIKQYKELNERVERDSIVEKKTREQTREAWRRKKGLIRDIPVQSPLPVSSSRVNRINEGNVTSLGSEFESRLPPVGREENSSLDTVIHNGTIEVMTHRPAPGPLVVCDGGSSSDHASYSPPPPTLCPSETSASSTLLVRQQLERKSLVQRQKSFSAHGGRRLEEGVSRGDGTKVRGAMTSPVIALQAANNIGMSAPMSADRLEEQIEPGRFIRLPPVRPPGASRPVTTRSLGRTGKAWDLHLPLEVSIPGQLETMDKATCVF